MTNEIIEDFNKWWDSYESSPPKSSVMGYLVRKINQQKQEILDEIELKKTTRWGRPAEWGYKKAVTQLNKLKKKIKL